MDEEEHTHIFGRYVRKRDGAIIDAVTWPDGDVTWMPAGGNMARLCSEKTFARNHVVHIEGLDR